LELQFTAKQPGALPHAEQPQAPDAGLVLALGIKPRPVINDTQPEFVRVEVHANGALVRVRVPNDVAQGLLNEPKGGELQFGRYAHFGAGHFESHVERVFILEIGNQTGKRGDQPEAVEGRWTQVASQAAHPTRGIERLTSHLAQADRHVRRYPGNPSQALDSPGQVQE
jgi:hypothetical protein